MLQNCRIISVNTPIATYLKEDAKRGDPNFVMSRSHLRQIALNPRRWLNGYGEDEPDTKATTWGSLVDCLLLQPDQFESCYAVTPAKYQTDSLKCPSCGSISDAKKCRTCNIEREKTTVEKDWTKQSSHCQEWEEKQIASGKTPITSQLWKEATNAVNVLRNEPEIAELIDCSQKQVLVMGEWVDSATQLVVPVKGLLDLVPDKNHANWGKSLGDLKTSKTANPARWARECFDRGYDWQASWFLDLYIAATKEDRCEWVHVLQENYHPYETVTPIPMLSVEFVEMGRLKYQSALAKYCRCLKSGEWPGYSPQDVMMGRQLIKPEAWMMGV